MQMYEEAEIIPPDSVCTACVCQEVTVMLFLGKKGCLEVPRQYAVMLLHFLCTLQNGRLTLYLYTGERNICQRSFSKSMAKQRVQLCSSEPYSSPPTTRQYSPYSWM